MMDELMYVKHEFRSIDLSLKRLSGDFIRCIEEHFTPVEGQAPLFNNYPDSAILPLLLKRFEPGTRRPTLNSSIHMVFSISSFYVRGAARSLSHLFLHLTRTLNSSSLRIPSYNRETLSRLLVWMLEELEFFRDL